MAFNNTPGNATRVTGATEVLVVAGPCVLLGLVPEATTTGTITVRDAAAISGGSTPIHTAAIGLLQAGKMFGNHGIKFNNGLTITLSVAGDALSVLWAPV